MKLNSRVDPVYLPEAEQHTVLRMGLKPLALRDWILADEDLADFHRHKMEQAENDREKVYQVQPGSEETQREFSDRLLVHLLQEHEGVYRRDGNDLIHRSSGLRWRCDAENLWQSSLWVQEDICLLEARDDVYYLTAASVCAPSNWKLEEKSGRPVSRIHDPVPGYERELSARVNRLLAGIKPEKPLHRFNWSIQQGNELFWRDDLNPADTKGEKYWRVERQTLLRLPVSGAIVFGIRIFLHSFEYMKKYPEFEKSVTSLIRRLPADQRRYKKLDL